MNNTGTPPLEIVLWTLLANAVLIASAYGATRWLRGKAEAGLSQIEDHLRRYDERLRGILAFQDQYKGALNDEPFQTPLSQLSDETRDLAVRMEDLDEAGQALRGAIEQPAGNQLQVIINAPFRWWSRWQQTRGMVKESHDIEARLLTVEQSTTAINQIPWKIALEVRKAQAQAAEMARLAQSLQQHGARGSQLQSAAARIPVMQRSLAGIAPKFMNAQQAELLSSAPLAETTAAHAALNSARPIIEHWLPYLKEWEDSRQKAASEIGGIQQAIGALRRSVAQPPSGLKADPMQERLALVTSMSNDLERNLAHPEVEHLKHLMREATRIRRLAEDAGLQINRAGERAASLNQTLTDLKTAVDSLAAQFKSQEEKPAHPLVLDESSAELNRLRQALAALGPAGQERTPEQISAGLDKSTRIRARHTELLSRYQKAVEQHQALLALLESAELKEGAAWIVKTREMLGQAEMYDPHHWAKTEAVDTLKAELTHLARLQERAVPVGQAVQVKESRLNERLQEARHLADLHKSLRSRAAAALARLEKIQALEKEGKEKLSTAWNALERASILTNNNELLRQVAEADIQRQTGELRRLGDELNARNQGLIEKKVQAIQAQYSAVIQAIQSWMARLDAENKGLARRISDRLAELDNIASLEDPSFLDARKLVSSADLRGSLNPLRPTGPLRNPIAAKALPADGDLSAEMKRKNDLWHSLHAAEQALNERSEAVLTAYHETLEARTQAQSAVGEITARQAQRRTWPPHNQPPLAADQGLSPVDARWDAMRKQHVRSDWAILELGKLANQYRSVADRAANQLERISQDQDAISALEQQIEELKIRWLQQGEKAPDNAILFNGIQQLASRVDSQMAYIRQQWARGTLSYAEVQQNLRMLSEEVFTARVPVDENRDMGLPNQRPRDSFGR